jgi:uncharacterized protein (DUF433 family)
MSKAPDRTPWDGIIVTDADTCFGKARIAGTRLYVDIILQWIEHGSSLDDLVREYPEVSRSQFQAAIGFARDLVAAKRNRLKGERRHAPVSEPTDAG